MPAPQRKEPWVKTENNTGVAVERFSAAAIDASLAEPF